MPINTYGSIFAALDTRPNKPDQLISLLVVPASAAQLQAIGDLRLRAPLRCWRILYDASTTSPAMYVHRIQRGLVNPSPEILVEEKTAAVALVDGDNGMGFIAAHRATDEACDRADKVGIGLVNVQRRLTPRVLHS